MWEQVGAPIYGSTHKAHFGASLSFSDDSTKLAVGAPGSPGLGGGYAMVYYRNDDGNWTSSGDLMPENDWDLSVYSVCLSGDGNNIAVGGIPDSEEGSVAKVFQWQGDEWRERGSGIHHAIGDTSYLAELSADGNNIVVSNYFIKDVVSNSGIGLDVRAYTWSEAADDWEPRGSNIHELFDSEKSGYFINLSRDASRIAMGDPGSRFRDMRATGHVQVLEFDGTDWVKIGDNIWGEAAGDQFGHSISISGNGERLAVGAPYNRALGEERGRVTIYEITDPDTSELADGK